MASPVKSPQADSKGSEVAPGTTEVSPQAFPQELRSDAPAVPGETEEAAQAAARKPSLKRRASKVRHRDDPKSEATEAHGATEPTKSMQVTHAKTEEGPEATAASSRMKKHHRSKVVRSSKGKKEGDKSPEEPDKKDSSTKQGDGTAKASLPEAPVAGSTALVEVPVEAPLVEAPAVGASAIGTSAVEAPAAEAPAAEAPAVEAPTKARETKVAPGEKTEAEERSSRRKSKVAIMDVVDETEDASQGSRWRTRRGSQYSRKDSMASTRRMDSSWRTVASTATSKIIHRALHPMDGREHSVLDAEEERVLASVGCAFLLTFVAIFAGIAYFVVRGRSSTGGILCNTPECMSARGYLAGLLRLGGDTCSGFYHYVCGSWSGGNSSFAQDVSDALALRLHRGLLATSNASDRQGRHVAAETYRACHRYVHYETTLEEVVQLGRRVLGTKDVLRADSFPELIEATLRVSLTFGIPSGAISLNFVNVSGRTVVHISAGKCLMSKLARVVERNLGPFLTRMLMNLPEKGGVNEIVAQLVKLDAELCQSASAQNSTDVTEELRTFLDDLLLYMKAEDWIFAINRVLPSTLQIRPEQSTVVTGTDSVRQCFELIVESGLKIAAIYLATSLEVEVARLESEKQLVEDYEQLTIRFCLGLSQRTVTMTWQSIVAEFVAKAEDGASVVRGMFRELQSSMNYGSSSHFWLREDSRERAAKLLQATSLAIGIYDSATVESDADYSLFRPSFGAARIFIARFLETLRHNQEVSLRTPPTRTGLMLANVDPFGDVDYVPSLKTVLLPAVFLTEPYLYSTRVPVYFNYGIVGSLLASGLAKAIVNSQGLEDDHPGGSQRRRKLERNVTLACLRRLHNKLGFKQNVSGTLEEQDDAMYALAQGAVLAHTSLAADMKALATDPEEYASVWPEAQTTFFLRFCLWSCSGTQHPSPLSPMERCILPLHNMPAFVSTFGCDKRGDFFKSHCSF